MSSSPAVAAGDYPKWILIVDARFYLQIVRRCRAQGDVDHVRGCNILWILQPDDRVYEINVV